jgi:hypothetical protein
MSQSPTASAATPDVIQDAEPTLVKDGMSHAPVSITRALHRPSARRSYPPRSSLLELSRMSREMDRL